ncbi:MAG TPA: DUF4397 domain-containing protein [Actinomycetota bacterium]
MKKRLMGVGIGAALAVSTLGVGTASAADASLNVVHGIPGVNVEVCVNGSVAIPGFAPGDVVTGVALPAGSHDVKIVGEAGTCEDPAILEATGIELASGKNYTAVAHLTEDGTPTLGLFTNQIRPPAKGIARLTIRHTAAAPPVDVWANGRVLLEDVPNGASATLQVRRGVYAAWVSLPNDYAPVIGPAVLKLKKGVAYQVYAWGSAAAGYDLAVVAVPVGSR